MFTWKDHQRTGISSFGDPLYCHQLLSTSASKKNQIVQMKRDSQAGQDATRGLLRSVVSSVIIAIYGYAVKRLLYLKKRVERTERGNQELEQLIGGYI